MIDEIITEVGGIIRLFARLHRMGFFGLCKRNLQEEGTALAEFAFHPNLAAVTFRNGFDDGKSQPGAALCQRFTMRAAIEFLEQSLHIIRLDANAAVLDGKGQGVGGG